VRWWDSPNSHVLGGFDLHRKVHGTWLGVTRQGRIAVLTNYREEGEAIIEGARSRGEVVNAFLNSAPDSGETTEEAARRLVAKGVKGIGGFSLIFGRLQDVGRDAHKGLAVISNRTPDADDLIWLAGSPGETHALSNSYYGDQSWPKVSSAEIAVKEAVRESSAKGEDRETLLKRFFEIMSRDTLPERKEGQSWEIYSRELRKSIFIPAIGGSDSKPVGVTPPPHTHSGSDIASGPYGTQKQSIILVSRDGDLYFIERTLFDSDGRAVAGANADRIFEFKIEGW
jgi:uncharacterized protein with NRDE domain